MKEAEVSTETSSEQEEPGGSCPLNFQLSSAVAISVGMAIFSDYCMFGKQLVI